MRCYSVSGLLSFLKENFDNIKFYETSSKRKKSEEFPVVSLCHVIYIDRSIFCLFYAKRISLVYKNEHLQGKIILPVK